MPIMSPSDKFSLLVSFLFAKMAAGDPLPAQMEVTISSHPSWIIKPPTALKDGAEALPSQQSNLEDFLQKEHVQHREACRQAILNIPLIIPSPHNSDNESDLEPTAPKPPRNALTSQRHLKRKTKRISLAAKMLK